MQPTTLSKSRFKIALECPRKLVYVSDEHNRYVNTKNSDDLLKSLAEGGHQVGALAKLMYPGGIEITAKSIDDQIRETEQLLKQEEITLFEPTFRHGNLLVRVDVLVKRGVDIKLIEVKAKGFDSVKGFRAKGNPNNIDSEWAPYIYDVAFQTLVLERSHEEWNVTPYLMLLDKSASASEQGVGTQFQVIHQGDRVEVVARPGFDPASLDTPLLTTREVSQEVQILRAIPVKTPAGNYEFDALVKWLGEDLAKGVDFPPYIGSQCKKCEFYCEPNEITDENRSGWAECFAIENQRPTNLSRSATVFGLYKLKVTDALLKPDRFALVDVDIEDFKGKKKPGEITLEQRQVLQVEEAQGEGDAFYLERDSLRDALAKWRFPLHFIDFETSRPALPFHKGRKPNEQLLFQFSHHVLSEEGQLRHANECLITEPGEDPSIDVVRALRDALAGNNGTVVHWWDHEKTVLGDIRKRIASSDEQDREDLVAFIDAMVGDKTTPGRLQDLGRLISRTAFFRGTNGRSSIKKVLPAVLSLSKMLKERYSQPIYGTELMPSLNFPAGWIWLQEKDGQVRDPYELLEPTWLDNAVLEALEQGDEEDSGSQSFVANGGAAMVAYAKLQRPDLSRDDRRLIEDQLKRYCELDTLAMVMVYESIGVWMD